MTMTVDGVEIGFCTYGVEARIQDYSRKERDEFGNITLIPRGYTDIVTFKLEVPTANSASVRNLLASKRATLATYIGDAGTELTQVEGYLNEFTLTLTDWQWSDLSIEVESKLRANAYSSSQTYVAGDLVEESGSIWSAAYGPVSATDGVSPDLQNVNHTPSDGDVIPAGYDNAGELWWISAEG